MQIYEICVKINDGHHINEIVERAPGSPRRLWTSARNPKHQAEGDRLFSSRHSAQLRIELFQDPATSCCIWAKTILALSQRSSGFDRHSLTPYQDMPSCSSRASSTAWQMVRDILEVTNSSFQKTGVPQAILESGPRPSRREASLVSPIMDPNHPRLRLESHLKGSHHQLLGPK